MSNRLDTKFGATILEVMLTLSIMALIIVMAVRYYQTSAAGQQAAAVIAQVQFIAAAADQLSVGTVSYADITDDKIKLLVPNNAQTTPWGTEIKIINPSAEGYQITLDAPRNICPLIVAKLLVDKRFTSANTCNLDSKSDMVFQFSAIPST